MAAAKAIETLQLNLAELVRQRAEWEDRWRREVNERHEWQAKYHAAAMERDAAIMERDVARAQGGH